RRLRHLDVSFAPPTVRRRDGSAVSWRGRGRPRWLNWLMAAAFPTGTVTFLLTDIEGSTRLVQDLSPDRWREVLEDHNRLLRSAIESYAGVTVKTEGDALFSVFASAHQAVEAAIGIQRALQSHPWPDDAAVKVRVGLHTGEGALGGDDYVGSTCTEPPVSPPPATATR